MDRLVTIITVFNPHETGLPCSLLDSEGIECFVQDTMSVPYTGLAGGGIKLQVRESEALRAIEILKDGGFISSDKSCGKGTY